MLSKTEETLGHLKSLFIYRWKPLQQMKLRRFYAQFIGNGDLAFDIGSHIGNRVYAFRQLGATAVAAEPHPWFANYLRQRFEADTHVHIHEIGIGENSNIRPLHISRLSPTLSTFSNNFITAVKSQYSERWDYEVEVQVEPLEYLLKKHGTPQFIKIDVEGLEQEVICNLKEPVNFLSFEILPASKLGFTECIDHLSKLSEYEYNHSKTETMKWTFKNWLNAKEIHQWVDLLAPGERSGDIYCRLRSRC